MNPANYREALTEMREDESEGADILLVGLALSLCWSWLRMDFISCSFLNSISTQTIEKLDLQVKPALPYLDVIRLLRDNSPLPIAAYQVFLWPILAIGKNFWRKDDQIFNEFQSVKAGLTFISNRSLSLVIKKSHLILYQACTQVIWLL